MTVFYNEWDKFAAQWIRNLAEAGELPRGTVDDRSITELRAADLVPYRQCHFFAGIGGWPLALRLAGVPEDRELWTASFPCQPFSQAGKRRGFEDERHLWPIGRELIAQRRPPAIFGEQVASNDGIAWFSRVRFDLEAIGYAVGSANLCAAGVFAPQIRQRLYWVAYSNGKGQQRTRRGGARGGGESLRSGVASRLASANCPGQHRVAEQDKLEEGRLGAPRWGDIDGFSGSPWASARPMEGADGSWRLLEPGIVAVGYGIPRGLGQDEPGLRGLVKSARGNQAGRLRGYGNAICPILAAEFICAAEEARASLSNV